MGRVEINLILSKQNYANQNLSVAGAQERAEVG